MDEDNIGYLGPFGALRAFSCLPANIVSDVQRPNFRGSTLDGRAYTQQTPRSRRIWAWPIEVGDPATLRELFSIEQGVYGPPPYRWYDPWAAELNLLPQGATAPGSVFDLEQLSWNVTTTTVTESSPVTTFNGLPVAYGVDLSEDGVLVVPGFEGHEDPVPVLPGRPYTFTVSGLKTAGEPWEIALVWVDGNQAEVAEDAAAVPADPAAQRGVLTGVAPAGASGVLAEVRAGAYTGVQSLTMFQLTETSEAVPWHPGQGVPRVSLPEGYRENLIRIRRDECDFSKRGMAPLTLVEVG